MHKVIEKLKEEFFAVLPPTIFFFVALHLVVFIRVLMAKGGHFEPLSTTSIAVAALILGKAVLIADVLPAINRYPDKPLAYNVAWKTVIYFLMATVIHYVGATHRFFPAGRRCRRRQREAARRNRVAAFLGGADHPVRTNPGLLHRARTGARDR
jgi:hypothetical protein